MRPTFSAKVYVFPPVKTFQMLPSCRCNYIIIVSDYTKAWPYTVLDLMSHSNRFPLFSHHHWLLSRKFWPRSHLTCASSNKRCRRESRSYAVSNRWLLGGSACGSGAQCLLASYVMGCRCDSVLFIQALVSCKRLSWSHVLGGRMLGTYRSRSLSRGLCIALNSKLRGVIRRNRGDGSMFTAFVNLKLWCWSRFGAGAFGLRGCIILE